jgi:hypothetical protein
MKESSRGSKKRIAAAGIEMNLKRVTCTSRLFKEQRYRTLGENIHPSNKMRPYYA